jgi:hypothetical protein
MADSMAGTAIRLIATLLCQVRWESPFYADTLSPGRAFRLKKMLFRLIAKAQSRTPARPIILQRNNEITLMPSSA